jgi:hypothetical protein
MGFHGLLQGQLYLSWEDNIKMDIKEIGCNYLGWMYLN